MGRWDEIPRPPVLRHPRSTTRIGPTAVLVWGIKSEEALPKHWEGPLTCGGAKGTRTPNPLLAKQVRYQLRHGPLTTMPARTRRAGGIDEVVSQLLGVSVASAQSRFSACLDAIFFWTATAPTAVATRRRIFFTGTPPGSEGIGGGPNRT